MAPISVLCRHVARALMALIASGCWSGGATTRLVDGRTVVGRNLPPSAYDAYARAATLESEGKLEDALGAYEEALDIDNESPELWTRFGAVACRLKRGDALGAFDEAMDLDDKYAPAYREMAECLRRRRHYHQALENAQRAAALSPEDVASTLLVARLLESRGQRQAARNWLFALAIRNPGQPGALKALRAFAVRVHDRELRRWVDSRLLGLETEASSLGGAAEEDRELERLLLAGHLVLAREEAQTRGMSSLELAERALAVGALPAALEQSRLVFRADPGNADARILLLVAALQAGEHDAARSALMPYGSGTRPSAPTAIMFANQLSLLLGEEARAMFLSAYGALAATPVPVRQMPPLPQPPENTAPTDPPPKPSH